MSNSYLHGIRTQFMTENDTPIKLLDASIGIAIGTGTGADDKMFPLNKAALISNESQIAKLGDGSLSRAVKEIYKQGPALIEVIRVEHDNDMVNLKANIIGTLDNDAGTMTGMQAVLNAEQDAGKRPRLLICPEIQDIDVAKAMESISLKYGLIPIVEADGTGFASHDAFTKQLSHAYIVAGGVKYFDADKPGDHEAGGSAVALGIIIRTDNQLGFARSPSNKLAYECKVQYSRSTIPQALPPAWPTSTTRQTWLYSRPKRVVRAFGGHAWPTAR